MASATMTMEKSPIPKYYRLKEMLAEKIVAGVYRDGEKLPGVNDLAAKYSVSRVTASKALSLLQEEGLVKSSRGTGTIVSSQSREASSHADAEQQADSLLPASEHSRRWWEPVIDQKTIVHISSGIMPRPMGGAALRVVSGLESVLGGRRGGGRIVYLDSGESHVLPWREVQRQVGSSQHIAGFIVQPHGESPEADVAAETQTLQLVQESGLPALAIGVSICGDNICCVNDDDYFGIRLAVDHLASLGHSRILWVGGGYFRFVHARKDAFERAMLYRKLPVEPANVADFPKKAELEWFELGYEAAKARLADREFSAVVAINDDAARGVIQAATELGMSVPEDLSVTGFDDLVQFYHLNLTTVHTPWEKLGEMGPALLADMLLGNSYASQISIRPHLVVRRSTAPCASD